MFVYEAPEEILRQPEIVARFYTEGLFPMADKDGAIRWYEPVERTVIFPRNYNFPRSLRSFMRKADFEYRYDFNTLKVVHECANRKETWISRKLIEAYEKLHEAGYLHSVEVYRAGELVGGLYGIAVGGAFFGESMFSRVSQASKSALIKLLKRLNERGFEILDVQLYTEHLAMFGTVSLPLHEFKRITKAAAELNVKF